MASKDLSRIYLILFGGVFFVMSALPLIRFSAQPPDIWWTPKTLSVPVADASDRVEVYVRDVLLQEQARAGRIQLTGDLGTAAILASDVRLRFNNWDRVRAATLPSLLVSAFCAGATGVLMLLGIVGWIPRKPGQLNPGVTAEGRES